MNRKILHSVRFLLIIAIMVIVLSACRGRGKTTPSQQVNSDSRLSALNQSQILKGAQDTATLTEISASQGFGMEVITPEAVKTSLTDKIPAMTPTATTLPPAEKIELPPSVDVVILMGTDYSAPYVGRTDTMILLFADRQTGKASLVSIPRDLLVHKPNIGAGRINTVFVEGGSPLLFDTLEYNLGIRPEHYALAHLDDFIRIVDDLGGIDVMVTTPMPFDCGGIPPGKFHMDGEIALCYVRERQTTSDFDRSRRQQEMLKLLFNKFLSLENFLRLPQWYSSYGRSIESDMGLLDLLNYVPFALRLYDQGNINFYQIGWNEVTPQEMPESGASILLGDAVKIKSVVQQAVGTLSRPEPTSALLATRIMWLTATPTWTQPVPELPTSTDAAIPTVSNQTPEPTAAINQSFSIALTPTITMTMTPKRDISATIELTATSTISPAVSLTVDPAITGTQQP